jgi:hypothetical protein
MAGRRLPRQQIVRDLDSKVPAPHRHAQLVRPIPPGDRLVSESFRRGDREVPASFGRTPAGRPADGHRIERWAETERERCTWGVAQALEALGEEREREGDRRGAVEWWRRLAMHDPYSSRVVPPACFRSSRMRRPASAVTSASGSISSSSRSNVGAAADADARRISDTLAVTTQPRLRGAHTLWRARIAAQLGEPDQEVAPAARGVHAGAAVRDLASRRSGSCTTARPRLVSCTATPQRLTPCLRASGVASRSKQLLARLPGLSAAFHNCGDVFGRRGACLARREEGAYLEYSTDEQRHEAGCIGGRMSP